MIFECIPVGLLQVNCYVVGNENEVMVIDPGDSFKRIWDKLEDLSVSVKYIVLTHCHFDHIMAAEALKKATNAEIVICELEKNNFSDSSVTMTSRFSRTTVSIIPDKLVKENDVLLVGGLSFRIIETPGHTSGGMCLYCKEKKILFSGDTLFCGSIGRSDFPTGNLHTLLSGIQQKLLTLPNDTEVYPGHDANTTIAFEKQNNPYIK